VEKKTGSIRAKSFSSRMRCMRTEPTMPRQPTRPTACVMFNALGKMDKKAGYPDNLSECGAEMLHCGAKGGHRRPFLLSDSGCRTAGASPASRARPQRRDARWRASAQRLEHGVAHLRRRHLGGARLVDVCRAQTIGQHGAHGRFDTI